VTSITADTADNVGSVVLLFRAVIFAMTDLTAVLAGLVLVVTKGTVQSGKLAKLVPLELVLAFRDRSSRLYDIVDELLRLVNLLLCIGHDETV